MTEDDTDDGENGKRLAVAAFGLLGVGVLFVVGMDLALNQAELSNPSPFPVYAFGFVLGVWATATMAFVSNYVGRKLFDVRCVSFGFPRN